MKLRMFLLAALLPLLPLAAADFDVKPFVPVPGDAATLRAMIDLLEGGRVESETTGAVNSLAFADPGKRQLQILLWNTGTKDETARMTIPDADQFFQAADLARSLRLLRPGATELPEAERAELTFSGTSLRLEIPLPPGAAALVELRPKGTEEKTYRIDTDRTLTLRIPGVPGSGHLRIGFETRAESPAPVTLEVSFMRRQRFLAVRKFTVTAGTEWKPYSERYPIPAGTTHVNCKVSGGPAEIRSLGLRPDQN